MQDDVKDQIAALVPRLRRFARVLSGNREDADDIVQTACVKALAGLGQFTPGTRLDAWMYRIVRNSFLDRVRANGRRGEIADPDLLDQQSDGGLGARQADGRLMLAATRKAVAQLPPEQRAVLALVALDGLSYADAAAALDIPIGTVMSRLGRARKRLSHLVGGGEE